MRVIALETSERIGSVAALETQKDEVALVRAVALPDDQRSAQSLLPTVQKMLTECDWQLSDLDLVCVVAGPGSFTGLRIGITVAKVLAYATGAKLVGVPTLSAIAASVPSGPARLWAILDAQRQELFAAEFTADGWLAAGNEPKIKVVSIEEWMSHLREGDTVVGPPLKKLAERLPAGINIADETFWPPQAELVGRLGIAAYRSGKEDDPMQLVPQYYRKSAAEEKADATELR